jgi:hypothetical protein
LANLKTGADFVGDAPDGRTGDFELAGKSSDGRPFFDPAADGGTPLGAECWLPPEALALLLRSQEPLVRPFNNQISLKLRDRRDDAHGHLSRWTGEVNPPERQAVDTHAHIGQPLNGLTHIHGVPTEPVQLRDYQYVVRLKTIEELLEARALDGESAARDAFLYDALALNMETRRRNLMDLIHGGLFCGADAGVEKGSGHWFYSSWVFEKGVTILLYAQNKSRLVFEHVLRACTKTLVFVRR